MGKALLNLQMPNLESLEDVNSLIKLRNDLIQGIFKMRYFLRVKK